MRTTSDEMSTIKPPPPAAMIGAEYLMAMNDVSAFFSRSATNVSSLIARKDHGAAADRRHGDVQPTGGLRRELERALDVVDEVGVAHEVLHARARGRLRLELGHLLLQR